jgi:hypothetical protein
MAAKVYKVCNCCLTRNQTPILMGARARIKHCRKCKCRTVWSPASEEQIAAQNDRREKTSAMIAELLGETNAA